MICPLISSEYGAQNCIPQSCRFTDEAGKCLIQQALKCYIQDKQEARAAREAFEKTTYADIFDAFFMPKGAKKEPAGAQRIKDMRSDEPVPPRYL